MPEIGWHLTLKLVPNRGLGYDCDRVSSSLGGTAVKRGRYHIYKKCKHRRHDSHDGRYRDDQENVVYLSQMRWQPFANRAF